ncbi:MAG: PEP-CTERM sorting domain-containing protein [Armatimonadota bacterium]|nr:PEP-CTERM sorting domain-containing protein [Armatimonadota bacterium]
MGAGKVVDEVSVFDDTVGTTNNYIWMDDLVIGEVVVPEPSSMLVFGTFGIAALGFLRRRRA